MDRENLYKEKESYNKALVEWEVVHSKICFALDYIRKIFWW